MIKIKLNKKAQIGSTLTWIVATLIIFFILIIFIVFTLLISTKKEDIGISKESGVRKDLGAVINLISLLKTEVSGTAMKDLILGSLDPYIERDMDLAKLDNIRWGDKELLIIVRQKDDFVFKNSQSILDKVCEDYMLKVPQGAIMKGREDFVPEQDFETEPWKETFLKEWGLWAEVTFPYRNQFVIIKYRQLKKC